MLRVLFIGDISGKLGRKTVAKVLPGVKREERPDLVVANAENSAHGSGVTEDTVKELAAAGVDWFTGGDHALQRFKHLGFYDKYPIIRPANFPPGVPGRGFALVPAGGKNILLINLIGRVFMDMDYDCPFRKLDEILANTDLHKKNISAIIIDMHAEATSEKAAFRHWADGRVSAVLGTHTHVMTADHGITAKGTAHITDTGMTGADDSCLGVDRENIIKTFLEQIKYPHVIPETGRAVFNAVLVSIDEKTRAAKAIKPIAKFIEIK